MGILATESSVSTLPSAANVLSVTSLDSLFSSIRLAQTSIQADFVRYTRSPALSSSAVFLDDVVWTGVNGPS
jgi:purine-cytosine permease-like protein